MADETLISIDAAASRLGITRPTLYKRLRDAGVTPMKVKGDRRSYLTAADVDRIDVEPRQKTVGRREVLESVATLGVALFSSAVLQPDFGKATREAMRLISSKPPNEAEAERFVRRLLGGDVDAHYRAGFAHALYEHVPHPDNLQAAMSVAGPAGLSRLSREALVQEQELIPSEVHQNLALFGSATSESLSRIVFGYDSEDGNPDHLQRTTSEIPLAYQWILDEREILNEERIENKWTVRRVEGRETRRVNWSIRAVGSNTLLIPDVGDDGETLVRDFLVITRIRNFIDPVAFKRDKFIVSWAGTHGVGTRAAAMVLQDPRIMQQLARPVEAFDEFQILLEVTNIRETSSGFEPIEVIVRDFQPLPVIFSDYAAAQARISEQRTHVRTRTTTDAASLHQEPPSGGTRPG